MLEICTPAEWYLDSVTLHHSLLKMSILVPIIIILLIICRKVSKPPLTSRLSYSENLPL